MRRVSVELTGIAPLLFNGWPGKIGDRPPRNEEEEIEQGWRRLHKNGHGIFWPSANIKSCWYDGAKKARQLYNLKRKGGAGLAEYIRSGIFIDPMDVPFGRDEADGLHEKMGRIPPGPKGKAVLLRRPVLNEWKLAFEVVIVDPLMTDEELQTVIKVSGMYQGMGGHRPEYGRYELTAFDTVPGEAEPSKA